MNERFELAFRLRTDNLFSSILLFSIVFQAVGIFPNTDTQPNFILLSSLFLLLYINRLKYDKVNIIVLFGCYTLLLVAFLLQAEHLLLKHFLTYTISLLSFFFIFVLVKNKVLDPSPKFIFVVTAIYAVVGAIQFFIPDFLSFMVTRSVDAALSFAESGRGSRSLTGEPAHLGKIFIILNVLLLFCICEENKAQVKPSKLIMITLLFVLVNVLVSRSFYAVAVHISILLLLIFFTNKKLFVFLFILIFTFLGFLISLINDINSDIRFVSILNLVISNPTELLNQGAIRRVFNIPLSLNNLKYFEWYGSGSDPKTFLGTLDTPIGILRYPGLNRAYGGTIEFALKFGALSIPLFITYFFFLFRISAAKSIHRQKNVRIGLFFACSIFILTFQDGSLAKPLPMLLLAYIYINRKHLQY